MLARVCPAWKLIVLASGTGPSPAKKRRLPAASAWVMVTFVETAFAVMATAEVQALLEHGQPMKISIEDIDLANQRYRLKNNHLEIAARHLSLRRYLGSRADGFPGQEDERFRVLIAEIVAEAVCADVISRSAELNPEAYVNADWDRYYAEYSEYMTKFLPIAHKIQIPG